MSKQRGGKYVAVKLHGEKEDKRLVGPTGRMLREGRG